MVTARRTQTVLVTGGAGFIGSHTCVELLEHGYEVVVVDDYSNSTAAVIPRIEKVAGRPLLAVYECDILDRRRLAEVFRANPIDAVLHFAAKKAVGESVRIPFEYYDTNVGGLTALLRAMAVHDVRRLVFSSSCSIYGDAEALPIGEQTPRRPTNPYAASKWIGEQVLTDAARHRPELAMIALRYFNPAGAHPSGLLGEVPRGAPNNVMPFLTQVAIGRQERLSVFGDDYPTPDGTAVRDYVHVMDIAQAHRIAVERLAGMTGWRSLNLGTGVGTSVLELIRVFAAVTGRPIPYEILGRRDGDVAALVADPSEVARVWGWRTTRDIDAMCRDAWRFQERNPVGYD